MSRLHVEAETVIGAPPETVWALVADARRYPEWGPWREGRYQRAGDESETGPGAVQVLISARRVYGRRGVSVERIVTAEPARRLVYEVIGGLPVRDYRGEVTLTPVDGGTRVRWLADWDRTLAGRVVHRTLRVFYPEMLAGLAAAAEREPASGRCVSGRPAKPLPHPALSLQPPVRVRPSGLTATATGRLPRWY
jgi:uncharacterized protein YndB with AHSA1/START domain